MRHTVQITNQGLHQRPVAQVQLVLRGFPLVPMYKYAIQVFASIRTLLTIAMKKTNLILQMAILTKNGTAKLAV
jgi:hypothetical protein